MGVQITDGVVLPCFAQGTRIQTHRGEVAVEQLRVGDAVIDVSRGKWSRIRWIGHRHVVLRTHPRPWDIQPVEIAAGALGSHRPARPLRLSPDHAVYMDGVLVPVRYLVNGATIVQLSVPEVTYWHVELEAHGALMAEGMPCESFLDTGNRAAFLEGGPAPMLHPDFARKVWEADACAPLVTEGPALVQARTQVLRYARALGLRLTGDPGLAVATAHGPARMVRKGDRVSVTGRGRFHIRSAVWIPFHTRPAETDTRRLGIAVSDLAFNGVPVADDDPRLIHGWHPPEAAWRWTDGEAVFAAPRRGTLSFRIAMAGTYWAPGSLPAAANAA